MFFFSFFFFLCVCFFQKEKEEEKSFSLSISFIKWPNHSFMEKKKVKEKEKENPFLLLIQSKHKMVPSLPPLPPLPSLSTVRSYLPSDDSPVLWGALGALSATLVGLLGVGIYRATRRFSSIDQLPPSYFLKQRKLTGVALRVGDADGFRFYHVPLFTKAPTLGEAKSRGFYGENTLSIRIAGVDAPESGHFGAKEQPFSAEAKKFLSDMVLGKKVTIQIHQRDQYSRLVGNLFLFFCPFLFCSHTTLLCCIKVCSVWVTRFWFFSSNVSLQMAKYGFATVYDRTGAVYGGIKEKLVEAEKSARAKKLGMWSQDMTKYVTPMDFKAKHKAGGEGVDNK